MKINWKVRFRNKAWLTAFAGLVIAFVYDTLSMLGIAPAVSAEWVSNLFDMVLFVLVGVGVVIDPTTSGVCDSENALQYEEPKADEITERG